MQYGILYIGRNGIYANDLDNRLSIRIIERKRCKNDKKALSFCYSKASNIGALTFQQLPFDDHSTPSQIISMHEVRQSPTHCKYFKRLDIKFFFESSQTCCILGAFDVAC
jgi:hypothetical protein